MNTAGLHYSLRTSGHLLLGIARLYNQKVLFLLSDSKEAMTNLQNTVRGVVDLTQPTAHESAITLAEYHFPQLSFSDFAQLQVSNENLAHNNNNHPMVEIDTFREQSSLYDASYHQGDSHLATPSPKRARHLIPSSSKHQQPDVVDHFEGASPDILSFFEPSSSAHSHPRDAAADESFQLDPHAASSFHFNDDFADYQPDSYDAAPAPAPAHQELASSQENQWLLEAFQHDQEAISAQSSPAPSPPKKAAPRAVKRAQAGPTIPAKTWDSWQKNSKKTLRQYESVDAAPAKRLATATAIATADRAYLPANSALFAIFQDMMQSTDPVPSSSSSSSSSSAASTSGATVGGTNLAQDLSIDTMRNASGADASLFDDAVDAYPGSPAAGDGGHYDNIGYDYDAEASFQDPYPHGGVASTP
ncbi:MAG: Rad21/Rec8 N-terminal domain-containing protein, partial [archaeon]|nr:Rad21/Rec8 N-terminal domain-containing protein [archaeon]